MNFSLSEYVELLEDRIRENDNLRDDEEVRFQSRELRKAVNDNEPEYIILELAENLEKLIDTIIKEEEERKTGGKKLRRKTKKRKSRKGKRPISRHHKTLSKNQKKNLRNTLEEHANTNQL